MRDRGGFIGACDAAIAAAQEREEHARYPGVPEAGDEIEVRFGRDAPWAKARVVGHDRQRHKFRVEVDSTYSGLRNDWISFWNSSEFDPNPIWQWRRPGKDNNGRPRASLQHGYYIGTHRPACPPEVDCSVCARASELDPEIGAAAVGYHDYTERDRMAAKLGLAVEGDDAILVNGPNGPEVIKRRKT